MIIFDNHPAAALEALIDEMNPSGVFVLVDTNTEYFVWPKLREQAGKRLSGAELITVKSGDLNKNIESLAGVWRALNRRGASRGSLLVNLGGGIVCDLGGFAAATFKRGIRFINVPTTLLAAVDASVGGKTGINLDGYKNEIGVFRPADAVVVSTCFFSTLSDHELLSGYAEMLKHALLEGPAALAEALAAEPDKATVSSDDFLPVLRRSIEFKQAVVESDPCEKGLRRVLNLGHTAGHAFETFAMTVRHAPLSHGHAVALGLCVELVLSHLLEGFPTDRMYPFVEYVKRHYSPLAVTCDDYPALLDIMSHDKKNPDPANISFTLLRAPGDAVAGVTVAPDDIRAALDIYRDLFGI